MRGINPRNNAPIAKENKMISSENKRFGSNHPKTILVKENLTMVLNLLGEKAIYNN